MTSIKDYIGNAFIGNAYRFTCDCIMKFDVSGTVVDYEKTGNEVVLIVMHDNKTIRIGLNTPSLFIEEI